MAITPTNIENRKIHLDSGMPGKITGEIGSGANAQNSLVYLTLKYSFYTGIFLTCVICVKYGYDVKHGNKDNLKLVEDIESIWKLLFQ